MAFRRAAPRTLLAVLSSRNRSSPLVITTRQNAQPESFEKKGRGLPSAPRAWPPRDNGKYEVIGALPPRRDVPGAPALPAGGGGAAAALPFVAAV